MKAFIAYRFTGEDPKELKPILVAVRDTLKDIGIDSYTTFFDEEEFKDKTFNAKQIMDHAFGIIDNSDILFVIQTSENRSEGMLMEVGYCIAKKKTIIAAVKQDIVNTYVPDMAKEKFYWNSLEDLKSKIMSIKYD